VAAPSQEHGDRPSIMPLAAPTKPVGALPESGQLNLPPQRYAVPEAALAILSVIRARSAGDFCSACRKAFPLYGSR
jgi:hypothetical protein